MNEENENVEQNNDELQDNVIIEENTAPIAQTQINQQPESHEQYEQPKNNYVNNNENSNSSNGMAIASFILGIVGLFAWLIPIFGYAVGIPGLILAIVSRKRSKTTFSIIAIVLCSLCLFASVINSIAGVMIALNLM